MPVLYARVELIFDPGARIIDYVYREVNPTFEKYILPKEKILGKKYSELNPDYSPELPDRYSELNDNRQITFQYYPGEDENSSDRHLHTFQNERLRRCLWCGQYRTGADAANAEIHQP
ncbi:hypothetical protein NXW13_11560 [Bacteroides thetaiotaomicron]|nr:hypothetical protein [Bacteroides thetaiotaomicron]